MISNEHYNISISSDSSSTSAIVEFKTNKDLSNFNCNFMYVISFNAIKENLRKKRKKNSFMGIDEFLTTGDINANVLFKLSNNAHFLAQVLYLLNIKVEDASFTSREVYSYLIESIFFNLKSSDTNATINQFIIDFGTAVAENMLVEHKITCTDEDILLIRQLGAKFLGVDDETIYTAIASI